MKNLTLIFAFFFIGWSVSASVNLIPATKTSAINSYNDSFIFVENGVEFAIYPDGQFDFYYNPGFRSGNSVQVATPNVNISYNSGYNYEPYIQYDDYGAVIQVESVPIYYDFYGRIVQAGDIFMDYNNFGRLARVGNLRLHYNNVHHYTHYTGFINNYNRSYVYRPWHDYYRRPMVNVSVVFGSPYRAYYEPRRVSYNQYVTVYNTYYANNKRKHNFYRPAQKVKSYNYGHRTTNQRDLVQTRSRSRASSDLVNSRQSASRNKAYSSRSGSTRENNYNRGTISSGRTTDRGTVARSSRTNKTQDYGARTERSTDSKGRTSRVENSVSKRPAVTAQRSVRTPERSDSRPAVQKRSTERIERSTPANRSRSVQNNTRSVDRKSSVERPTRQRSSTVQDRSSNRSSRTQSVRTKTSSGSRSSARNVDN